MYIQPRGPFSHHLRRVTGEHPTLNPVSHVRSRSMSEVIAGSSDSTLRVVVFPPLIEERDIILVLKILFIFNVICGPH